MTRFKSIYCTIASIFLTLNISCLDYSRSLEVAPIFSDHMVLQQLSTVPIWGKGNPGDKILIQTDWGENIKVNVASNGQWNAILNTISYGGPYSISIENASEKVIYRDILLGEVWLISGQSNMEWPMVAGVENDEEEIKYADYKDIRFFKMPYNLNEQNYKSAKWEICTPESVKTASAVGYFFSKKLYQELKIPIGIISSSWGGTRVEAWTSINKLSETTVSRQEAIEILKDGGPVKKSEVVEIKNKNIVHRNEEYLNLKSYPLPSSISEWERLDLDDFEFSKKEFDDSKWDTIDWSKKEPNSLNLEDIFNQNKISNDGVVWFRRFFSVDDLTHDYNLVAENGIDDYDYTFINGQHVGTTLACCMGRNYLVPKELLKKEDNLIAIRMIDVIGDGGFKGDFYLEGGNTKIDLQYAKWKFKHTAFYLNSSIQPHKLSYKILNDSKHEFNEEVKPGILNSDPNKYGILYETMIKPIVPYTIKGVLWYQGEQNVKNSEEYKELFTAMIDDWRSNWDYDLPFYFVQIAPYSYDSDLESYKLREAQRKTLNIVEKTGMVVTMDIGEESDIHPRKKMEVGYRLARLALKNDYNKFNISAVGPLYKYHEIHQGYLKVFFENDGGKLILLEDIFKNFEIAESDGIFHSATAVVEGNYVKVFAENVLTPVDVRYGWKNWTKGSLFNSEGLPASSFNSISEK